MLYRASCYYCDQPSSVSQAPSACGVRCSIERLVFIPGLALCILSNHLQKLHTVAIKGELFIIPDGLVLFWIQKASLEADVALKLTCPYVTGSGKRYIVPHNISVVVLKPVIFFIH